MARRQKAAHIYALKKLIFLLFSIFILWSFFPYVFSQTNNLVQAKVEDRTDSTRVIITSGLPLEVFLNKFGSSLEVRLKSPESLRFRSEPVRSRLVRALGWASTKQGYLIAIDCATADFYYKNSIQPRPFRLEIELRLIPQQEEHSQPQPQIQVKPEEKMSSSVGHEVNAPIPIKNIGKVENRDDLSLPPAARRIRTIVIDPGHGGLETGARGPNGTLEKDITLAISLKLKEMIERRLALRVVLTRDKDVDVSLENRAALANNNRADLFISIHANGAFRPKAHGSETYFLSLKASDEEARRLAYLENNSPEFEKKIEEENQNQIMMILWDMAQAAFLKQSSELAEIIQTELNKLLGTANRGVKQAPFKVLTGVACPAVLVEVAFISNPEEEAKLKDENFQASVAEAIYQGLLNYLRKIT